MKKNIAEMELSHFRKFEIPLKKYNFKYIKQTFQTFCLRAVVHCDAFRVDLFPLQRNTGLSYNGESASNFNN